jgi:hypothetical protein
MSSSIAVRVAGKVLYQELLLTPVLEGPGLRIAADQVHYELGTLRFRLLLARSLPLDFTRSFSDFASGLTLIVRAGSRVGSVQLMDPTVNRLETRDRNFVDLRDGYVCSATIDGYLSAPIAARIGELPEGGALAHLALLHKLSNVIRVAPPHGMLP